MSFVPARRQGTLILGGWRTRTCWHGRTARPASVLHDARIITTQVDAPRAMPAADLAAAWRSASDAGADLDVVASESVDAALEMAIRYVREERGPLLVLGSLYLVGAVRGRLVEAGDAS